MDSLKCQKTDRSAAADSNAHTDFGLYLVDKANCDGDGLQKAACLKAYIVRKLVNLRLVPYDGLTHAGVVCLVTVCAELLLTVLTVVAGAAEVQEVACNAVANLKTLLCSLGADLYDNAGQLVSHAVGGFPAEDVLNKMGVRAADGAVSDFDADIFRA